jgi:hypothetical protein
MTTKEDIQGTLDFWIQNRIHGISAMLCRDAQRIDFDVLSALDKAREETEKHIRESIGVNFEGCKE